MNKKQNGSAILAGIAITAILVASSLIAGNQFTQQAHAQATTTPPSTTTAPSTTAAKPAAGTPSPLAGRTRDNVAVILPLRKDGGLYTGVVTFTASKSVQPQIWNVLSGVGPTTNIGREFGTL